MAEGEDTEKGLYKTGVEVLDDILGGGVLPGDLTVINYIAVSPHALLDAIASKAVERKEKVAYLTNLRGPEYIKRRALSLGQNLDGVEFFHYNGDEIPGSKPFGKYAESLGSFSVLIVDEIATIMMMDRPTQPFGNTIKKLRDSGVPVFAGYSLKFDGKVDESSTASAHSLLEILEDNKLQLESIGEGASPSMVWQDGSMVPIYMLDVVFTSRYLIGESPVNITLNGGVIKRVEKSAEIVKSTLFPESSEAGVEQGTEAEGGDKVLTP